MVTDLQTMVAACLGASADLCGTVSPVHSLEHIIIQDLHPELDPCGTEAHGTFDLCIVEHIGTGLHGESYTPVGGSLVQLVCLLKGLGIDTVHGIEASANEPLLVFRIPAGECASHDDQVDLVGLVSNLSELHDAVIDLGPWIETVPVRTSCSRLLTCVRLGRTVLDPSRTIGALPMRTIIGRCHHRDDRDTAHGAHRLLDEIWCQQPAVLLHDLGQDIGVWRYTGKTVLLAELQFEVLKLVTVADTTGFHGIDYVVGQVPDALINHSTLCRNPWVCWIQGTSPRGGP